MKNDNILKKAKKYGGIGWTLNTIKFTFNYYDIFSTGLYSKNKKININKQKKLNNYCSKAHIKYKKYLLAYTCYLFGAVYSYCNSNKIKFQFNEVFLLDVLDTFFKLSKYLSKKPEESGQYLDFLDSLPLMKNVNLNKNFYIAHMPHLKKKHLLLIVKWFLVNFVKNNSIQKIFYGSAHYMALEHDPILRDKRLEKIITNVAMESVGETQDQMMKKILSVMAKIYPTKFIKFKKSGLNKDVPLRLSYWYLVNRHGDEIKQSYLTSNYKDKFISDIIYEEPDLKLHLFDKIFKKKNYHKKLFDQYKTLEA